MIDLVTDHSPAQQEARRIASMPRFPDRRTAIKAFLITHPEIDANDFYIRYFFQKMRHDEDAKLGSRRT